MASNSEIEKLERRWQENPLGLTFAPLAEAYRKAGETAKALELLEVGLAQHPNYVPAHIVRGRCHADAQQVGLAEQSFRRVTELDPENAIALKGLADLAESEGRVSEAIARLETMLEVDRNNEDARGQLDRLRELPVAPLAEPEVELVEQELTPAGSSEYQAPDASAELAPSEESYPEIVLQAAELEKSLPVAEAAQGIDLIAEPDPAAAVGHAGLDEDLPVAALDEAVSLEPELAPEPIADAFEPEAVPEPIEVVNETEAVLEAEPVEEEWPAESIPAPEPAMLTEPEPEPEPETEPVLEPEPEPVAEPAAEAETAPAEPELVVTETMAEIFLRQGHRELALAVYSQLAQRDPLNERVAAAAERLRAELAPAPVPEPAAPPVEAPRRYAAATTGGRSVAQRFAELLAAVRPPVAAPVHPPTFEASRRPVGEATRPAPESLSLSSVFGEEAAPAGPAGGPAPATPAEPSFEQFFSPPEGPSAEAELPRAPEQEAPALSSMAPEDLEQFNAWLRGLKR